MFYLYCNSQYNLLSMSNLTKKLNFITKFPLIIVNFRIWILGRQLEVLRNTRDFIFLKLMTSLIDKLKLQVVLPFLLLFLNLIGISC